MREYLPHYEVRMKRNHYAGAVNLGEFPKPGSMIYEKYKREVEEAIAKEMEDNSDHHTVGLVLKLPGRRPDVEAYFWSKDATFRRCDFVINDTP